MCRFINDASDTKELLPITGYKNENPITIDEAVRPIKSQVSGLDQSVKTAKNRQYPTEHGLTRDEAVAIYLYTMEGADSLYKMLNEALRSEDRTSLKPWFSYLKLFDRALNKLPTVKECIWRGQPYKDNKEFKEKQILVWCGVNSCSLSVKIVESFVGPSPNSILFMIEPINGKSIASYSEFEYEQEVILRPGTRLMVKSNAFKHPSGLRVVHLVEIDSNDHHYLFPSVPVDQRTACCGGRA